MLFLLLQSCGFIFLVVNQEQFPSEQTFVEEYIQSWCEKAVDCDAAEGGIYFVSPTWQDSGIDRDNLSSCISVLSADLSTMEYSASQTTVLCDTYKYDLVDECLLALEDWSCEELKDRSDLLASLLEEDEYGYYPNQYENSVMLLLDSPTTCFQPYIFPGYQSGNSCDGSGEYTHPADRDGGCSPSEETVCAFDTFVFNYSTREEGYY